MNDTTKKYNRKNTYTDKKVSHLIVRRELEFGNFKSQNGEGGGGGERGEKQKKFWGLSY